MMNYRKICIICEGYEEEDYFNKLISLNVFAKNYAFKVINAKSISNIYSHYQSKYQSNSYHLVLMFCDTDKLTQYMDLKKNINSFHDENVADDLIIFGNPCTMQIILSHFMKINLKSPSKKKNAPYIKEVSDIDNYDAHADEREKLFKLVKRDNYLILKENLKKLKTNDQEKSSTNFLKFIERLENKDVNWIKEINDKL